MGARKKPLRCPKCRRFPDTYAEHIDCVSEHDVDKNGWPVAEGVHIEGSYYKLIAHCSCGHSWRVKNAIQITDVMEGKD